jgi:flavin-dependent dehydrogenase
MYDVIVVGARCAGAPTAMLLARRGHSVLLVDRGFFPSDMPMSTHLLWPPAVLRLERWDLLDRVVASGCPPISTYEFDMGGFTLVGSPPAVEGVSEAYSPRRYLLDGVLVEAAVAAGAELRERFTIEDLVVADGRVTGIRGRGVRGTTLTETARLVVGADGPRSIVARRVGAPIYNSHPVLQGTCWTYWSGVPTSTFEVYPRDYRCAYAWRTADGLTLVGVNWIAADFARLGTDAEAGYFDVLEATGPDLAAGCRAGRREERWSRGCVPSFFRRPYGPGWALVGDAGYTKDPCTAAGITDAFRDAELLASAIHDGLSGHRPMEAALAEYERQRNLIAGPFYDFICELATFTPPPPEMARLFAALRTNQAETDRFLGLFAQTVSPAEFFAPASIDRILSEAGFQGLHSENVH